MVDVQAPTVRTEQRIEHQIEQHQPPLDWRSSSVVVASSPQLFSSWSMHATPSTYQPHQQQQQQQQYQHQHQSQFINSNPTSASSASNMFTSNSNSSSSSSFPSFGSHFSQQAPSMFSLAHAPTASVAASPFTSSAFMSQPQQSSFNASSFTAPSFAAPTFSSSFTPLTHLSNPVRPTLHLPTSSSSSSSSSSSASAPSTMRAKRGRSLVSDDASIRYEENEIHPNKKQHGDAVDAAARSSPFLSSTFASLSTGPSAVDEVKRDTSGEDEMMQMTPTSQTEDSSQRCTSPLSIVESPTTLTESPTEEQVDGEIDTDQWNLTSLKLAADSGRFLEQMSSEQAKRAAGFDATMLRDIQRELDQRQGRNGVVRAVWDKNSHIEHPPRAFSQVVPPQQQDLVLYQKPSPIITPSTCQIELAEETPSPVTRGPIVEEIDDQSPIASSSSAPASSSSTVQTPTSSSPDFMPSSHAYELPSTAVPPPFSLSSFSSSSFSSSSASSASSSSATSSTSRSATSSHSRRHEKRRRDMDEPAPVTSLVLASASTVRIEEVTEDEHEAKKRRTREKEQAAAAAAASMSDDTAMDEDESQSGSSSSTYTTSTASSSCTTAPSTSCYFGSHYPATSTKYVSFKQQQPQHQQPFQFEEQKQAPPQNNSNIFLNSSSQQPQQQIQPQQITWNTMQPSAFQPPHTQMMW